METAPTPPLSSSDLTGSFFSVEPSCRILRLSELRFCLSRTRRSATGRRRRRSTCTVSMIASPRFSVLGKNLDTAPYQRTTTLTRLIEPPFSNYRKFHLLSQRNETAIIPSGNTTSGQAMGLPNPVLRGSRADIASPDRYGSDQTSLACPRT